MKSLKIISLIIIMVFLYIASVYASNGNEYQLHITQMPSYVDIMKDESEGLIAFLDKESQKWGYLNENYEIIIQPKYETVEEFYNGLASVGIDYHHNGLIDKQGNEVISLNYDIVYRDNDGYYKVGKISDKSGFRRSYYWGIMDSKENIVIPMEYDTLYFKSNGLSLVEKDHHWGFIDIHNNVVIPLKYERLKIDEDGLLHVEQNGKYGLIDQQGNVIIPAEYDSKISFSNGLSIIKKDDKWGFIDMHGNIVIPIEYDYVNYFEDGLASARKNGQWGFIDRQGNWAVPPEYDYVYGFECGLAAVKKDSKWGFIDTHGQVIIPIEYDEVKSFIDGVAEVKKNLHYGVIAKDGNVIIPMEYNSIDIYYSKDMIEAKKSRTATYYNKNGDKLITYNEYGLYICEKDDLYGAVDKDGNIIIDFEYQNCFEFHDGCAFVTKDGEYYGVIDTAGKVIYDFTIPQAEYNYAAGRDSMTKDFKYYFSEGLAAVNINGKWGYIDTNGNIVIEPQYNLARDNEKILSHFHDGYTIVQSDNWLVIDKQGNTRMEIDYSYLGYHKSFYSFSDNYVLTNNMLLLSSTWDVILHCQDGKITDGNGNIIADSYDAQSITLDYYNSEYYVTYKVNGVRNIISFRKLPDAIYSDISAFIDGHRISSCNINGNTAIIAEDLSEYGFDVDWDETDRTLNIHYNKDKTSTTIDAVNESFQPNKEPGEKLFDVYSSDIKVYLNGEEIDSFNLDGKTAIYIDALNKYGDVLWDEENRMISFKYNLQ